MIRRIIQKVECLDDRKQTLIEGSWLICLGLQIPGLSFVFFISSLAWDGFQLILIFTWFILTVSVFIIVGILVLLASSNRSERIRSASIFSRQTFHRLSMVCCGSLVLALILFTAALTSFHPRRDILFTSAFTYLPFCILDSISIFFYALRHGRPPTSDDWTEGDPFGVPDSDFARYDEL